MGAQPRILYVNATGQVAGAENSLLQLLAALDRRAYRPVVALPGPGPLADALEALHVPWLPAPACRLRRTWRPDVLAGMLARAMAANRLLTSQIRPRRIRLVHASGLSALAACGPAARRAGVPCVLHLRDLRFPRTAARLLGRLPSATIAVSRAVADAWGMPAQVVPNGIDADAFAARARPGALRQELGLAPGVPVVLVVSQMAPWKGHATFLRAFALARVAHPEAVAVVAGADLFGDNPGYAAGLRRLATELGLRESVRFLGQRADVPTLMADADLLVVPSDAEPFGRVALEAMAVGLPVMGHAAGGLPEVVEDGVTGRLAPPAGPDGLAHLMGELLADAATRARMGRAGRRVVRERFDIAGHAARVCALYDRLLADPTGR